MVGNVAFRRFISGLQIQPARPIREEAYKQPLFDNPFELDDLLVFDRPTLQQLLNVEASELSPHKLALSLHGCTGPVVEHIFSSLVEDRQTEFHKAFHRPASLQAVKEAQQQMLDKLFWELTYWKTPELYEELTEGEKLHPGIFEQLGPSLKDKIVLDAGAGTGRASFECLRRGAKQVYAVEPSPGLLKMLKEKAERMAQPQAIVPLAGRFEKLPLDDHSVDVAISCSAFTSENGQGGESGLAELRRVTKPGGQIVIIWPRPQDRAWLRQHGFSYQSMPLKGEMQVRFRSLKSAFRCVQRFYARNREAVNYLMHNQQPEIPFSVLGFNPPHDYCWLKV